jgi:hypothetical protein
MASGEMALGEMVIHRHFIGLREHRMTERGKFDEQSSWSLEDESFSRTGTPILAIFLPPNVRTLIVEA